MGTTKLSKNCLDLSEMTYDTKKYLYASYFSMQTNTPASFEHKIELLTLLSYISQQLNKRFPDKFRNTLDAIYKYIYTDSVLDVGDQEYLEALSIICDDLLFGVNELAKPTKYSNSNEVKNRIKELISERLPF